MNHLATSPHLFISVLMLLVFRCAPTLPQKNTAHCTLHAGAITRADTTQKTLSLVFTGHEFSDGGEYILQVLKKQNIKSSFFFTGDFYRNVLFEKLITDLKKDGHYLGAHSDKHLLYCDWERRDSLLVSRELFLNDLGNNYVEMSRFGIEKKDAPFFLPPYEWYNDSISFWTNNAGLQLINFTHGTRSNADYTTPDMSNYLGSEAIFQSIIDYEKKNSNGLNGFILLVHTGTAPERMDKFYFKLEQLILFLKNKGYQFERIDGLIGG